MQLEEGQQFSQKLLFLSGLGHYAAVGRRDGMGGRLLEEILRNKKDFFDPTVSPEAFLFLERGSMCPPFKFESLLRCSSKEI